MNGYVLDTDDSRGDSPLSLTLVTEQQQPSQSLTF